MFGRLSRIGFNRGGLGTLGRRTLWSGGGQKKVVAVSEGGFKLARASGVLLGIGLGVSIAGTLNFIVEFPEPCQIVWTQCEENALAKDLFGEPMSRGWFWDGSVTDEQASVTLNVSGPKGSGTAYGRLLKTQEGGWEPILIVARSGNDFVNLYEKQWGLKNK